MDGIILILEKYIGFQKYIPVPDCKNINFEEIHWFSDIYIYLFRITKISILRKYIGFQIYLYLFRITKISILKKSMGFQKYIPVSDYKNFNFEEIHWFSEIYTCFGLQKYQFWRNTLVFRNIYLFRITKISILKKYIGFQQYIPVSDYNTYCLTKRFVKYIYMVSLSFVNQCYIIFVIQKKHCC